MRNPARKVHVIRYTCEDCGAEHSCQAGLHTEGLCLFCGSPMRIQDLFSDRRIVTVPVTFERRALAA